MLRHSNRSHAWAAAAVGATKGLVQIQMADIRAVIARSTKAHLRVHVRAVQVNLTTVPVHDLANFTDGWLKDAVRGGIRHH